MPTPNPFTWRDNFRAGTETLVAGLTPAVREPFKHDLDAATGLVLAALRILSARSRVLDAGVQGAMSSALSLHRNQTVSGPLGVWPGCLQGMTY